MTEGTVIGGRWTLMRLVGQGGAGQVWEARDESGVRGAVKLLRTAPSPKAIEQFRHEALLLALFRLPGVARVLGWGTHEGIPYVVMRWVDGLPFPGEPRCSWEVLVPRLRQLLTALDGVHRLGVVHRDLSPPNVLVGRSGQVVVLDFGIATHRHHDEGVGSMVGNSMWMAPEQLARQPADARADLYAVGLLARLALTGLAPRRPGSARDPMRPIWADEVDTSDLDAPEEARRWLAALLQPSPASRPRTAAAALASLPSPTATGWEPPWLGDPELPGRIAAGAQRRLVRVAAPRGAGATRLLREVRALVGAELPLVDRGEEGPDPSRGVRVVPPGRGGDVALRPMTRAALERLFVGPERIFGMCSGPAGLVLRVTGGVAGLAVERVRSWIDSGFARVMPAGVEVDMDALVELQARPSLPALRAATAAPHRVLGFLAAAGACTTDEDLRSLLGEADLQEVEALVASGSVVKLEDGRHLPVVDAGVGVASPGLSRELHLRVLRCREVGHADRWFHAWVGGVDLIGEGGAQVERLMAASAPTQALALLAAVGERCRQEPDLDGSGLAIGALQAAMDEPRPDSLALAARIARDLGDMATARLAEAGRRSLLAVYGELESLPHPHEVPPRLQLLAARIRAMACRGLPAVRLRAETEALVDWWQGSGAEGPWGPRWEGHLAYVEEDYDESLRAYRRAMAASTREVDRLTSVYLCGEAALEGPDPQGMDDDLADAARGSVALGFHFIAARCEVLRRCVAYRSDRAGGMDLELLELLGRRVWPKLEGRAALTEAAIAWRAGDPGARDLALRAHALTARVLPEASGLAGCLLAHLGVPMDRQALMSAALDGAMPRRIAAQMLGLLGGPRVEVRRRIRETDRLDRRLEVMSLQEVLDMTTT